MSKFDVANPSVYKHGYCFGFDRYESGYIYPNAEARRIIDAVLKYDPLHLIEHVPDADIRMSFVDVRMPSGKVETVRTVRVEAGRSCMIAVGSVKRTLWQRLTRKSPPIHHYLIVKDFNGDVTLKQRKDWTIEDLRPISEFLLSQVHLPGLLATAENAL